MSVPLRAFGEGMRMTDWVTYWRVGGEACDARAATEALTEDAELVSPLTNRFSFHGREVIQGLLAEVFEVYSEFHYVDELRDDGRVMLVASARVRGEQLTELQHLTLDTDGRISRVTLAMRPLPAVTAFQRALGPRLARRQGRPGAARILSAAGTFLDRMTSSGDRRFTPLADPNRDS